MPEESRPTRKLPFKKLVLGEILKFMREILPFCISNLLTILTFVENSAHKCQFCSSWTLYIKTCGAYLAGAKQWSTILFQFSTHKNLFKLKYLHILCLWHTNLSILNIGNLYAMETYVNNQTSLVHLNQGFIWEQLESSDSE